MKLLTASSRINGVAGKHYKQRTEALTICAGSAMSLTEYRRKRDFRITSEPRGERAKSHRKLTFVVQKHAASHLHYDFRLELDGVLLSWAVPKGPSLDPTQKRLAMHVEDHPLEYGKFEGVIPQGEYGGGTVMLWDRGTWKPVDDGNKGYRAGSLKFELKGEKLKGKWMLVRRGGKRSDSQEKHWFLFKERDEYAEEGTDITKELPLSIDTGRDLDEIASDADRVWGQNGKSEGKKATAVRAKKVGSMRASKLAKPFKLTAAKATAVRKLLSKVGTKRASSPTKAVVQLATLVDSAPEGDQWMHEIKFDGYRMLCHIDKGKVKFISRNGKEWTDKFDDLPAQSLRLPVANAIIDGEVVILDEEGKTSFQLLQNAFQLAGPANFLFYAFDLLYLDGYDVSNAAIEDRKSILQKVIPTKSDYAIKYSEHVIGNGETFFAEAARLGLEGIISKRLGRPYAAGRGNDWLKVKCSLQEEFVIGGFTEPSGSRTHFGALLLGYYDDANELVYAGRVGTGFNDRTLSTLHKKFKPLIQKTSPFKDFSGHTGQARGVTWLNPVLVGQVQFSNWTGDRQLRHPSFQGLREDKPARAVVRDAAVSPETTEANGETKKMTKSRRTKAASRSSRKVAAADGEVAGVRLSHPDKVLFADDDITKLDLARHYEQVAEWMLPHVENRLLSLVRCPAGSGQKCFFQKHPGEGTPDELKRFDVAEKEGSEEYLALYDLPGLVSLVQMGVLEIHQWGSTADKYEKPDRLVIDLDPDPAVKWPQVVTAAKEVKLLLEELDLVSFVKTTGGKGLHIVVPINRRLDWDGAKEFCRALADFLVAAAPDRYIAKMSKAARKGKIFVDYLRNDRGSTAIAPYSTRAKPGATVSVPIKWDELNDRLTSDHFTINNLPARLARLRKDPWAEMLTTKQNVTAAMLKSLKSI